MSEAQEVAVRLERVARAIWEAEWKTCMPHLPCPALDELTPDCHRAVMAAAAAAIQAMA